MTDPNTKAFPVSWEQFHRDARALSWRLSGIGSWDAIVCITRGGLVPAGIRRGILRAGRQAGPRGPLSPAPFRGA